jgi:hypothetical protein
MFTIRREQSRLSEVASVMKQLIEENPDETTWLPGFALVAADLGYRDAAQRRLSELARTGFAMPPDGKRSASLSFISEVAVSLDDTEAAQTIYDLKVREQFRLHRNFPTDLRRSAWSLFGNARKTTEIGLCH